MNTAKCAKNCQVPLSTTTANSFNSIENSNGKTLSPVTATANPNSDLLEMYECLSPECPNSPNVTMAGSPRGKRLHDVQVCRIVSLEMYLEYHFSIFYKILIRRSESSIVSRIHREIRR